MEAHFVVIFVMDGKLNQEGETEKVIIVMSLKICSLLPSTELLFNFFV